MEYAARLVANTDAGWNNFNSVVADKAVFNDSVDDMKQIIKGQADLTPNNNGLLRDVINNFNVDEATARSMYAMFESSNMQAYTAQMGNDKGRRTYNSEGIPDCMYAIVVMQNESGGNPNAINAKF